MKKARDLATLQLEGRRGRKRKEKEKKEKTRINK
jgi:hypothetical protein